MSITVSCPSCERRLRVPDNLLRAKVKCPTCGTVFLGDSAGAPPAPPKEKPTPAREQLDQLEEVHDEPPPDDEHVEEPQRKRSSVRRRQEDEEDEDDYGIRKPQQERPGKVQAIGIMMLVGGILGIVLGAGLLFSFGAGSMGICCLWPGFYYGLIMGILATIKGAQLLGDKAHLQPPPRTTAILMIINAVNGDMANLAMGIICLVFLNEPEVKRYFRG
jgi:predicted Zn finger-like uncharacterized protein